MTPRGFLATVAGAAFVIFAVLGAISYAFFCEPIRAVLACLIQPPLAISIVTAIDFSILVLALGLYSVMLVASTT